MLKNYQAAESKTNFSSYYIDLIQMARNARMIENTFTNRAAGYAEHRQLSLFIVREKLNSDKGRRMERDMHDSQGEDMMEL